MAFEVGRFPLIFWKYACVYCFTIFLMVNLCYGLYEDQIGLFDWKHKSIGKFEMVLVCAC